MALENAFNRLKREIGIKRCIIIDGNVGDVYINEKGQIINLSNQLKQILQSMNYDNIICWDKVDGTKDDISSLDLVESVEVEGDSYLDDGELNELVATPSKDQKNQEEFNTSDINE